MSARIRIEICGNYWKKAMKFLSGRFAAAALISIILLLTSRASGLTAEVEPNSKSIEFGMAASLLENVHPDDALAAIKVWAKISNEEEDLWDSFNAQILNNYSEIIDRVNHNTLDVFCIPTWEYLSMEKELEADPAVVYIFGDRPEVEYLIITSNSNPYNSLEDLEGKRAVILSKGGTNILASTWFDVLLMENGYSPKETFLKSIKHVQKPSQAILPVFFNQTDVAIVHRSAFDTAVELNPQIGQKTNILTSSKSFLTNVLCIRRSMDEQMKKQYVRHCLTMHEKERSFQTFTLLKIKRLVSWEPSLMVNVRDLFEKYHRLKSKDLLAKQIHQ